jgi:hypothetical protein
MVPARWYGRRVAFSTMPGTSDLRDLQCGRARYARVQRRVRVDRVLAPSTLICLKEAPVRRHVDDLKVGVSDLRLGPGAAPARQAAKQRRRDRGQQTSSHASHPWPPLKCTSAVRSRHDSRRPQDSERRVRRIIPLFGQSTWPQVKFPSSPANLSPIRLRHSRRLHISVRR